MFKEQFFKIVTPFRLILLIAVISIVLNLWFFGGRWLQTERQNYLNAGAVQLRDQVFQIATQQGWVIIGNSVGETIRLEIAK